MLPLLRLAGDGKSHYFRDAVEHLAAEFHLTDNERAELIPSGGGFLVTNRVGWARTYLLRPAVNPADVYSVMILRRDRLAKGFDGVWQNVAQVDQATQRIIVSGDSAARAAASPPAPPSSRFAACWR
jgi:hypothetical protein